MNYLLLTVLGATMFSNQQHQIVGDMIDMDTGEVILILPEKSEINTKFIDSLDVWGKDNVSTISFDEFKNLNSSLNKKSKVSLIPLTECTKKHGKKLGLADGLMVRMGISTGFCTVGNFGSDLRLDYTVLGSPVNLAARLQGMANPGEIIIDENTQNLKWLRNYKN